MNIATLRRTLINFVRNPNESWGEPTDGWGNPTDISTGQQARVSVEQADQNTARINSGTYTEEQYADFQRQLRQVEHNGCVTAYFSGDPDDLPDDVPERVCQCGKTFRTVKADVEVRCYQCNLDQLCPVLPGRHIQAFWKRDEWCMQAIGDVGFRNELTFWWYNRNSGGNVCHQGLTVYRSTKGDIKKIVFSTIASNARRCYKVTFDIEADSIKFAKANNASTVENGGVEIEELDDIVLDLMLAMMPQWMLYTHRPRNPVNGCFAVA